MPVPAAYHSHSGAAASAGGYVDPLTGVSATGNGLDFSYDPGHDGWTVGSPVATPNCCFYGAYFLPGTPFDGWSVQMNGVRSDAFYTSGSVGGFALGAGATFSGTNIGHTYTPGSSCGPFLESTNAGYWAGTYNVGGGNLSIRSQNRVDTNASWDLVNVTFKNTGAATITGLYYMVTSDPDNDVTITGGSFPTDNHISYQNDVDHRVEVSGRPPTLHQDAFSGLATKDCRAKALIYTAWPPALSAGNSLSNIYAGTATGIGTSWYALYATTLSQDIAYGIVYNLGNLAPGDSIRISYAWIFSDTAAIDSAFPQPQLIANCTAVPNIATVSPCPSTTIPVNIAHGEWGTTNWKWSPAIGLASTTGITNSVNITALPGATTYTITGTDTLSCNQFEFRLTVLTCFRATSSSPGDLPTPGGNVVCVSDSVYLQAHGDSLGATYIWRGPGIGGPVVGTTQYITLTAPNTMADTGWYYVIRTRGAFSDTTRTHVMLKPLPVINATTNAPICSGLTLNLTSTPDSVGETWIWRGPGGFSSTLSDPTRPTAITGWSGIYTVVATFNGCSDSATVNVVIDSTPEVPHAWSNTPVCSSDTLLLYSADTTDFVLFSWAGPGGYTSGVQNPVRYYVPTSASGVYTVTARLGVCTSTVTTTVVVDSTPAPPVLTSNGPVCSGTALNFTANTMAGSAYVWYGPNGFASGLQNPSISPATTLATGTYSVYATRLGCVSDTATLYAVVDSTPEAPLASSNSPGPPTGISICEGDTLKLFSFSNTAGVTYSWTGPDAFTSTLQNPMILNVTTAATGLYQVTAHLGLCNTSTIITVTITATPPLTATSNTPVCSGDTLRLFSTSLAGATYSWTGPYTFFSGAQNPERIPASTEHTGVYTVTAFLNGCYNTVFDTVVVNRTPEPPSLVWLTYCDSAAVPPLQAHGDAGSTITWYPTSAGSIGSTTPPIPPTANDTVMWFYVTQTVNGCTSEIDSMKVSVVPGPNVTVSGDQKLCPRDTAIFTAASADVVTYHWSPSLFLDDTTGPSVIARPETDMKYTVVAQNAYGCTDTASVKVSVFPASVIFLGDSVTIYPGESYQLNPQTNASHFTWFPPAGLSNANISNPVAKPEFNTMYIVEAVTEDGCVGSDSISIYVSTESLLALPNAFAPGSGANKLFKVLRRGEAVLKHFRIYDRWGVVVFQTSNIEEGWDGQYKGVPQPFGVYIYEVQAVTSTGKVFTKSGNVTLIR
ncbi:MAG: gliding motility-associated C-terminal domain-containing protein [Bacteroidota bacterium]